MDPSDPSPTARAVGAARDILADASLLVLAVRRRVEALADATDWRSRATAGYRAGIGGLADDLAGLIRLLDASDADLAAVQREERLRAMAQW